MLTASAAQPRNGTAPNAPTARAVLIMNSRRLCRFDKFVREIFPAESLRAFFMRSSLAAVVGLAPFVRAKPHIFGDGNRIQYCLQYDFRLYRWLLSDRRRATSHRVHDGRKTCQAHDGPGVEIAPD